jgi:mono/diheme cytochrome c family protein
MIIWRNLWVLVGIAAIGHGSAVGGSMRADPDDGEQVARSTAVYAEACASCHGVELEGQPDWRSPNEDGAYPAPPHNAEGHIWHHPDKLLFRYVRLGGKEAFKDLPAFKSGMPGFRDTLTDRNIWDVLALIMSSWPERAREYQRTVTENDN